MAYAPFRSAPRFHILGLALACLALNGCGTVMATPPAAAIDAPVQLSPNRVYTLNPGDTIKLTVYGEDTLTGSYTVDHGGNVTVPLVGEVHAQGLVKEDLQDKIAALLVSGGYLAKPLVTVDVTGMSPVYVMGEVKTPGSYPFQPGLDAFKAIALAGGYTPRAAANMLLLDRGAGADKKHMNANENTPLLPGDSITVRERIF